MLPEEVCQEIWFLVEGDARCNNLSFIWEGMSCHDLDHRTTPLPKKPKTVPLRQLLNISRVYLPPCVTLEMCLHVLVHWTPTPLNHAIAKYLWGLSSTLWSTRFTKEPIIIATSGSTIYWTNMIFCGISILDLIYDILWDIQMTHAQMKYKTNSIYKIYYATFNTAPRTVSVYCLSQVSVNCFWSSFIRMEKNVCQISIATYPKLC